MRSFWNTTKPFLIPFIITWVILFGVVLATEKIGLHLKINTWNSTFGDFFFNYYTHVGGAAFIMIILVALLFYKYSAAIFAIIAQSITALIIVPLKYFFAVDRPLLVFEKQNILVHYLEDFLRKDSLSFPSGHTGAAFALFLSLTVFVKSPYLKFFFFVLAVLVGYSRVYLSQHFTQDTLAGSLIGVIAVFITYIVFYPYLQKNSMLNGSLRNVGK